MDADVMITIAFCLEVFLFALAAGVFVAREARTIHPEAVAENGRERVEPAKMRTGARLPASANSAAEAVPHVIPRSRHAVRGARP